MSMLSPNKVRVFKRLKSAYIFFFPLQNSLTYDTHSFKSVPALLLLNVLSLYKIWGKGWYFQEKAFKIQTIAHSSNVQRHLCNFLLHIPIKFLAIINLVHLSKKEQTLPGNLDKNPPEKGMKQNNYLSNWWSSMQNPSKWLKILSNI